MPTESFWNLPEWPRFPSIAEALDTDVVVVGAGMTGVSAAYLLKQAGQHVVLLERERFGRQDTYHTTAHLTFVTDLRFTELVKRLGRDHAEAVWDAGKASIDRIEEIVRQERISCDFARVPGFLHAQLERLDDEQETLQKEAELVRTGGFEAEYMGRVPVVGRPGIRFPNQAVFHPLKYLADLVQRIPGQDSYFFENSNATEFQRDGERISVRCNGHTITCRKLIIATDVPLTGVSGLTGATLLQSRLAPYSSYAVGGLLPRGAAPAACFWDTSDPYYFLRTASSPEADYVIFGGLDHKTGQGDPSGRFERLTALLRQLLPEAQVDRQWSGQIIESNDGLPLIGETAKGQFVATGYSGNGITFGTVAAMIAVDYVLERKNPWTGLFDPQRLRLAGGTWNYVRENLDYPYYMLKDRVARAEGESLANLPRGQGMILKLQGHKTAAYRDESGQVTLLSPICTHLGCVVHWNEVESTWDCPCHGSRFRCTGEVLAGPAETPLKRQDAALPSAARGAMNNDH